jgi:DNA-binding LacI/PurR family transcriptional regulator
MNYKPNQIGHNLRKDSTNTIGILLLQTSQIRSEQLARIIEGAKNIYNFNSYLLKIMNL